MASLTATLAGIGYWSPGLPSWEAAKAFVTHGTLADDAPRKPSPQLLAPNERRRAPESVAVALDVSLAACTAAGRDPATLPSVFASTHGDLSITDYMCSTLVGEPRAVSPTKFHNSVHNAAAGYWTIGSGCMQAATAISAYDATFTQGLLEALTQLADGTDAVLLTGYDAASVGPLATVSKSEGLVGAALVLTRSGAGTRLRATLVDGEVPQAHGALAQRSAGNAIAHMLPLFDALASDGDVVLLNAGPHRLLRLEIARDGS